MGLMSFFVRLGLDTTQFKSGLQTAQSAGHKFARDIKSEIAGNVAAAFSIGAVTAFTKSVIDAADEVGDLADQLNITTDDVQKLQILANQTGVSFDSMASAINKVNEARQKAMAGPGTERSAFSFLGIGMSTLSDQQITNLDLVRKIGQAYQDGGKSLAGQAAVADLLGVKLVKAANAVADINKLGNVSIISEEDLKSLGTFNDQLDELSRQSRMAAVPALRLLADEVKRFNEESKGLSNLTGSAGLGMAANLAGRANPLSPIVELVRRQVRSMAARPVEPIGPDQGPEFIPFEGPMPEDGGPLKTQKPTTPRIGRLQMSSDPLQRIGGFTAFGTAQDRTARELAMQTRILRVIERATVATAREVSD